MENQAILITAASLGFIHTILGPDHYIPFVALSKVRKWSKPKTAFITFICGLGHVLSSIILGIIGIYLGIAVSKLEWVENLRGDFAGWMLLVFGLIYMLWGIKKAVSNKTHSHIHDYEDKSVVTFWTIFIIFVFGPCEPLIPIIMYPAFKSGWTITWLAALLFSSVTILTMMIMVFSLLWGFKFILANKLERYAHALAGFAILACGIAVKAGL